MFSMISIGDMEHDSGKKFPTSPKEYKLLEEIGEGVSATVYRAICIPLNEAVAIKVLDLEKCNNDLDGIRREVQTMSLIDHPNVLRALCSFTKDQYLWVVMPYMAAGSALHIMKSCYPDGFEEPVIATLLREVLKALAYLHFHGHIHRDVKAGNILIDAHGGVKLADFGVSACMFDTGDRQRTRNTFVGTPCWMAPEVMQQLHGYDFKADIWSFGITALELAHGHAPFSKYPPMKVLLMTLQNAPPGLDYERDRRFSKSFKDLVATCLVKDPVKRPSSEKLLKHPFFKHAKSSEYLKHSIVDSLPPLGERYRVLKGNEANLLLNNVVTQDKEQLSQKEYIRGISGWNFNIEDLKAQAAVLDSSNNEFHLQTENKLANEDVSLIGSASTEEDEQIKTEELGEQFAAAFSSSPLEALKSVFDVGDDDADIDSLKGQLCSESYQQLQQPSLVGAPTPNHNGEKLHRSASVPENIDQKHLSGSLIPEHVLSPYKKNLGGVKSFVRAALYFATIVLSREFVTREEEAHLKERNGRNFSGPLPFHHIGETRHNFSVVAPEETLDLKFVRHKGRFKVMDTAPKAASSANCKLSKQGNLTRPSNATAVLPTLEFLLQQNSMQKDVLNKLILSAQQLSDASKNISDSVGVASTLENELKMHHDYLQQRVLAISEDIEATKAKNAELEQQISAMSKTGARAPREERPSR